MKRFFALFLALTMLIPLSSCAVPSDETATKTSGEISSEKEKETKEKEYKYPDICDTLTLEALEAIPVAKSTMTEKELRQICLDYFYFSLLSPGLPSRISNIPLSPANPK